MVNIQLEENIKTEELSYNAPVFNEETNNIYLAHHIEKNLKTIIDEDMQSEQPLFINIKHGFIRSLAYKLVSCPKERIVIGVSGESASGKSTLTSKILDMSISEKHRSLSTLINSDNYYKDASEELKAAGSYEALFDSGFNLDEPQAVDLPLLRNDLEKIKAGEVIFTPEYNFFTIESIPNKIKKVPAKIILTEGLFVLENTIKEILDVSVYVHTPSDVIKERWYKRAVERGKVGKAADMLFDTVNEGATQSLRPYAKDADVVLSALRTEKYIKEVIMKIKNTIKNCL
ncbi:MAG: hypothetical protein MJ180_00465 [Candidatus Gastranaerophilales bacterium]|nr:hypothetical protein [Candidatus Gastranaerophilales bacterium]